MRYRALGTTGLQLSEIAFGCGDNAGLMIAGSAKEQADAVSHAISLGITYFDTAAGYGATQSETNLGPALKTAGAHPIICTKVEVTPEQTGDVAQAVIHSVEASLKRMMIDSVDIVEIHNSPVHQRSDSFTGWMPMLMHEYLGPKGALEGLRKLRDAGKVRFFGLVNERPDVDLARQLIATRDFVLLNVQHNLLNPTAGMPKPAGLQVDLDNGDLIAFAAQHGVGTAIFSPMARGVLTSAALRGEDRHPLAGTNITRNMDAYQRLLERGRKLGFLETPKRSINQAAIQFLLANPGVTTVLGGFTALSHIDEMVAALDAPALTAEEVAAVERVWASNFGMAA